jgi:hypothetical protein
LEDYNLHKINSEQDSVSIVRFKLWSVLFLTSFCISATLAFIAGGIFFAVFHSLGYDSWLVRGSVLTGVFLLPVIFSLFRAGKKVPEHRKIIALLDKKNTSCSGLLVAGTEVSLGAWATEVNISELPEINVNMSRKIPVLTVAALFLIGSVFVPSLLPDSVQKNHKMDISQNTDAIKKNIELLKEESIISEPEAEQLEDQLDELSQNAIGENPVKTWEALDHLKRDIQEKASLAAEKASVNMQKLDALQKIAEALETKTGQCDPIAAQEAMQSMNELLENMLKNNQELKDMLNKTCASRMSLDKLNKLAKSCGMNKEQLKKMLERLNKSGLIKNPGSCNNNTQDLLKFLKQHCSSSGCKKIAVCMSIPLPGTGAPERGPGEAPLSWHNRDMKYQGKFKDEVISSKDILDLNNSTLMATSASAPEVTATGKSTSGNLKSSQAQAGDSMTYVIHPRHRSAVKKYFNRKTK